MEVVRRERKLSNWCGVEHRTGESAASRKGRAMPELVDLVAHRSKDKEVGCAEPSPRHLSLGLPIRFTSGETSDRFAVCRRKGQ